MRKLVPSVKKLKMSLGFRNLRNLNSSQNGTRLGERGQVVVEYVLLLISSVIVAMLITRFMVGRDPGNPGFVISAWQAIVDEIGRDYADDLSTPP